ncbi:hypothetical protein EsHS_00006060 [Epichloe bromicola]
MKHVADHKRLRGGVEFIDVAPKNPGGKIPRRVMRHQEKAKMKKQGAKLRLVKVQRELSSPVAEQEVEQDNCNTWINHTADDRFGNKFRRDRHGKTCGDSAFASVPGPPLSVFDEVPPEHVMANSILNIDKNDNGDDYVLDP